jgi:autotransporter-associated beta strand protein
VTLSGDGLLDLNSKVDTIGSLVGVGNVTLGSGTLTTGATNASTTYGGVVSGSGGLTKTGTGTLTLSGPNSYTGTTRINAGTLLVNGFQPASAVALAGGTLGGTGTTGAITATGGTVAPGQSPGQLSSRDVSWNGATTYKVELNGTTAGTQYDQLNVTGTVALGGAALNVSIGYVPAPGDAFTVIANNSADAVTGTFASLPDGAALTLNGVPMQISYHGGTGNDVVLTVLARSNVGVQVSAGGGVLHTTLSARNVNCAGGSYQLQSIQFTRLANATVDVGPPAGTTVSTAPTTVSLPTHPPTIDLTVHRITAGQAATVEMTVTDGCGIWHTFVGGGPSAF